jgi:hypothetical protein
MPLKAAGIVIVSTNKLLIGGDSVMGCFVEAPRDGDASAGAGFLVLVAVLRVRVINPSRNAAATH